MSTYQVTCRMKIVGGKRVAPAQFGESMVKNINEFYEWSYLEEIDHVEDSIGLFGQAETPTKERIFFLLLLFLTLGRTRALYKHIVFFDVKNENANEKNMPRKVFRRHHITFMKNGQDTLLWKNY